MAKRFSAEQKTEHMDYDGAAAFWEHREQSHWNTWSSSFILLYPEGRSTEQLQWSIMAALLGTHIHYTADVSEHMD